MNALVRRRRLERDLADELGFHVQARADDWVGRGVPPDEALRRARIEFGGAERFKEQCRQARGLRLVDEVRIDARYAVRSLARTPAFTAVVLLLLALGIGANTAMFSLLDAVLWRMLPVREPEQLVFLDRFPGRVAGGFKKFSDISYPLMHAFVDRDPLLADATTFFGRPAVATIGGRPEPVRVLEVAENFYTMLGVGAAEGRLIQRGDGAGAPVVVLSHSFWQRHHGGAPVLGASLSIGDTAHTIVGVTPPTFLGVHPGSDFDLSTAMGSRDVAAQGPLSDPRARPLGVVLGRLVPGAGVDEATHSLTGLLRQMLVAEQIQGVDARTIGSHRIEARSASRGIEVLRRQVSKPLAALMGLVVLLLLLTSANVANLHLARSAARQREMAIRLSIGAGRLRLIRQLLTESLILALAGGLAGVAVAYWSLDALVALIGSGHDPVVLPVSLDGRTLAFTAGVSLLTGLLFGLAPAWRTSGAGVGALAQRGADRGTASMPSRFLVVAQVTLSMILLVGAGLFLRSFRNLVTLDAGYQRTNVLAVGLDPQLAGLKGPRVAGLYRQTLERVAALPGVRSASFERNRPLSGGGSLSNIRPPNYVGDEELITWFEEVGPRYFETIGIRLVAGRDFRMSDDIAAPKVIAINETAARVLFPGQDPLGRRMGRAPKYDDFEVVAIVADVRHVSLREPPKVMVYLPSLQDPNIRSTSILVRTTGDPLALSDEVRQIVGHIEDSVPVMSVTTLADVAARSLRAERLTATIASVFGMLALALAGVGLSGILLFGVSRRTREIGVRMALGATMRQVMAMVLRESTVVVVAGIVIGVPCAILAGRFAQSLLFGLSPSDPWAMGAAALMLVTVAALASIWPARRAAAVNPLVALRCE
jgi:predicted permease